MGMLSRFNPTGGIADFWNEFRRPQPYRIPILLVSASVPALIVYAFTSERHLVEPKSPEVFYITTFEPGRTDEEIMQSNLENQQRQDELRARIEELEEAKRDAYRALGRATGLDVDEMEAEAEAERSREEAEAAAKRREMLDAAGLEDVE